MKYLLIRIGNILSMDDHAVLGTFDTEEEADKEKGKEIGDLYTLGDIMGHIPGFIVVPYKELK